MSKLDELTKARETAAAELEKADAALRELTALPEDWYLDPGKGLMAGGVTIRGSGVYHNMTHDDDEVEISICVSKGFQYGAVFFIEDPESTGRPLWIDPEAVRAALKLYDMRNAEKEAKRSRGRATSARMGSHHTED